MRGVRRRSRQILWVALTLTLLGSIIGFSGCATIPIVPPYTQEELRDRCERQGSGWWHPDDMMGGYCEPIHS
jgi:hypothetical protein